MRVCVCVFHANVSVVLCLHGHPLTLHYWNRIIWMNAKRLCSVMCSTKDNCRQKNIHTEDRSWVIIRSGLEARNKCPCVIDYTLQANEINRAWIDWVGEESCQRGICSHVQWLYWRAHIQTPSERDQSAHLAENRAVSSYAAWSCFAHHCNQGQCCSNQMPAMRSDKSGTYRLTITAQKNLFLLKDKHGRGCLAGSLALTDGHGKAH